jgi:hypothetical protein
MMPATAVPFSATPIHFPTPSREAEPMPGTDAPSVAFLAVFEDQRLAGKDGAEAGTIDVTPVGEAPPDLAPASAGTATEALPAQRNGNGAAGPPIEITSAERAIVVPKGDDSRNRASVTAAPLPDDRPGQVVNTRTGELTDGARHDPASRIASSTDALDERTSAIATPSPEVPGGREPIRTERPSSSADLRKTGRDEVQNVPAASVASALADPRTLLVARTGDGDDIWPVPATGEVPVAGTGQPQTRGSEALERARPDVSTGRDEEDRSLGPKGAAANAQVEPDPMPATKPPLSAETYRQFMTIPAETRSDPASLAPTARAPLHEVGERHSRVPVDKTGSSNATISAQDPDIRAPRNTESEIGCTLEMRHRSVDEPGLPKRQGDGMIAARLALDHARGIGHISELALPHETIPVESSGDVQLTPTRGEVLSPRTLEALPKGPSFEVVVQPDARWVDDPAGETVPSEARASELRAGEPRVAVEATSHRADHYRPGTDQLTEIARRLPDGPVEVTLSPEELGKVRFAILGTEGQVSVQIVAERAETLDLLRRHVDVLASELRQQGYNEVSFSFGQGGGGPGAEPGGMAPATDDDRSSPDAPARTEPLARHRSGNGSLDLRL